MKVREFLTVALVILLSVNANSNVINNGDFQSCDFQHWQKDTDGNGAPGATGDFNINNNAGECNAEISVNIFDGATAFYANTLSTELDLSASTSDLQLRFDWDFSGFDDGSLFADNFFVALGDGTGNLFNANGQQGFLMETSSTYDSGTFSVLLNSSLYNQNDWTLDFTVQGGWNNNSSLSSKLSIDNVSLTSLVTSVPESGTFIMLCIAIAGLITQHRLKAK